MHAPYWQAPEFLKLWLLFRTIQNQASEIRLHSVSIRAGAIPSCCQPSEKAPAAQVLSQGHFFLSSILQLRGLFLNSAAGFRLHSFKDFPRAPAAAPGAYARLSPLRHKKELAM